METNARRFAPKLAYAQETHSSAHNTRQLLRASTKKAKAVSVGGGVASTGNDKCQLSSRHHMTPCTCTV